MKNVKLERILAIVMTFTMIMSMMLVFAVSGSAETESQYTLKASDLSTFPAGDKDNGDYEKAGTDAFFTVIYSEKASVSGNNKTFSDGVSASHRIAWGDKTTVGDEILNAVKIKTLGSATVKIWWVCGADGREVAVFSQDGQVVGQSETAKTTPPADDADGLKNNLFITEIQIPEAGIYYIGNLGGSNYFYQIMVSDTEDGAEPAPRADWSSVSAPVITSAQDNGAGGITVNVDAFIGHDGADELLVIMRDADGNEISTKGSVTEKSSHTLTFHPADSGNYTFKAQLYRFEDLENSKASEEATASFVYPLSAPRIASATSQGEGKINLVWNSVHEAEDYNIYVDGAKIDSVSGDTVTYTVSGLTIDKEYSFIVSAVRDNEELQSGAITAIATKEAKIAWGFTIYGPSTDESNNGYIGNLNEQGYVTVYSENGKGKIQPEKNDGIAFYYTAVPTEYNFTLRAKVSVDSWTLSNGQEGFGLIAVDRLCVADEDLYDYWNNSYLAGATKIEYKYNSDLDELVDNKVVDASLKKFSMKLGIGSISRTGLTPENIYDISKGNSEAISKFFTSRYYPLDRSAADYCPESGTYNVIGNYTTTPAGTLEERFLITEFIMEITKSNTGYLISYYNAETEELISSKQYYDPEALSVLDEDFVYVGFFASRNARATFSDVEFSTILASEDAPREYPDTTYVTPTVTVNSGTVTTKYLYELIVDANVEGTLTVRYNNNVIVENEELLLNERFRTTIDLLNYEENSIKIEFTPDPYQELPEFTELSHTRTVYVTHNVMYNRGNYHRKTIYISPDVLPYTTTADGTRENPFDIFTALENAYPGQTLILMEGTYKPGDALKIQRGMDGTADAMIRLIADPEAKTRPVIDFEKLYNGFTHAGDYWYFYGFDVTGSANMQKGFQVSGSYNVLDQINTYENGNSGIQLSRLSGSDLYADWPSYNLILNCTSYRNYDSGFEDADGFAAKLTIGDGNVFDGCIAYHNADDGWDLYAKVGTGPIGAVTIRNCISFENGFVPGAGEKTGNGNGFKMGGESIPGKHVLENSIAFNNLAKGIDSNSCPDVIVKNCISFNNGSHNVALYTNNADNTAFIVNGLISFRTDKLDVAENLRGKGNQIASDYVNDTAYYWNADNRFSINTAGVQITADMFVSLEYTGWSRNADGTINLGDFLKLKNSVPANAANCKLGGTPSAVIVLEEDEACSFSKAWYILDKTAHWHLCECGNKSQIENHQFIWIIDKPVVDDQTGLKHQECTICGYKKAAIETYPDKPATPPAEDDGNIEETPDTDNKVEEPVKLNFFQRIWQAIVNFFKNLFGGGKAYYNSPDKRSC